MPYSRAVQPRPAHEPALDGLRGIAALIVVIRHAFNASWIAPEWRLALAQSPAAILLNGQGAVQLFFVLSGFVLAGSLARSRERAPWPQFYVRRIFRIHPPYMAAVLVGVLAVAIGGNASGLSPQPPLPAQPGLGELARHLAFPSKAGGLLPVGWTLTIEMLFSFAMPVLVLAASFARGVPLVVAALALCFGVGHDLALYAIDFALGAVLWQERPSLARRVAQIGGAGRVALVAFALALWCAPLLLWPRLVRGWLIAGWAPHEVATMAAGSALLVLAALEVPWLRRLLATPTGVFLGRVSYASYLLHWALIALLAPRLVDGTAQGNAGLIVGAAVGATLLGAPFHRLLEVPSIAAGNALCRRLAARLHTTAHESHPGT
jgi:peptidoglycan/LPS O-acetylase OafA/YrhL